MTSISYIIILGLILTFNCCNQTNKKHTYSKVEIKIEQVKRIEIRNNPLSQTNEIIELKELRNIQMTNFISKWNNSKSKGLCKFLPSYILNVKMKDGSIRTFRANGQVIKEENDYCYDIAEHEFFKNLYFEANIIKEESKLKKI